MLGTGISGDNIVSAFRTLSQRRRHGVLEITTGEETFLLQFSDGRIVHVESDRQSVSAAVCARLVAAGRLASSVAEVLITSQQSVELFQSLSTLGDITADEFQTVSEAVRIDLLHHLHAAAGVDGSSTTKHVGIRFTPKSIRPDELIKFSVSPGQFLLDVVDLEANRHRLMQMRGARSEEEIFILHVGEVKRELYDAERVVWDLGSSECTLAEARTLSLLSEQHFCAALLSLIDSHALILKDSASSVSFCPDQNDLAQNSLLDFDAGLDLSPSPDDEPVTRVCWDERTVEDDLGDLSLSPDHTLPDKDSLPSFSDEREVALNYIAAPEGGRHNAGDLIESNKEQVEGGVNVSATGYPTELLVAEACDRTRSILDLLTDVNQRLMEARTKERLLFGIAAIYTAATLAVTCYWAAQLMSGLISLTRGGT